MYLDLFNKDILVIGCGNSLLGDDGFGPAVIESLEKHNLLAAHIGLFDAGTAVREFLFDGLLSGKMPKKLIIIDAVQQAGVLPGKILSLHVDQIPENKVPDYSLHQFPTMNMLKELKQLCLVDIHIYAVQVGHIPSKIKPGLSRPVKKAVAEMCDLIYKMVSDPGDLAGKKESLPC